MDNEQRQRRSKIDAEELCKQIKGLLSLGNTIPAIAKTLKMQRQLVEYYARYRKLSTDKLREFANKIDM